jgi:hypothetical protein
VRSVDFVAETARELLDADVCEEDAIWIVKTALLVEALKRARGNRTRAAKLLGIHRNSLLRQIGELNLDLIEAEEIVMDRQLVLFGQKKTSTGVHKISTGFPGVKSQLSHKADFAKALAARRCG